MVKAVMSYSSVLGHEQEQYIAYECYKAPTANQGVEKACSRSRVSTFDPKVVGLNLKDWTSYLSQPTQWARLLVNLFTQKAVNESDLAKL